MVKIIKAAPTCFG